MEEDEGLSIEAFPVLRQASAAVKPSNRSFDDPALGKDDEALGRIGSLDDLDLQAAADATQAGLKIWPLIGPIGIEFAQKRMQAKQGRHDPDAPVTILDVARMHDGVQQQTLCVYKDMALLAFDLLTGVIARRVNRRPPFSALLTLWLSMMAAVGLASRPAFSRHATYNTWCRRFSVPS